MSKQKHDADCLRRRDDLGQHACSCGLTDDQVSDVRWVKAARKAIHELTTLDLSDPQRRALIGLGDEVRRVTGQNP